MYPDINYCTTSDLKAIINKYIYLFSREDKIRKDIFSPKKLLTYDAYVSSNGVTYGGEMKPPLDELPWYPPHLDICSGFFISINDKAKIITSGPHSYISQGHIISRPIFFYSAEEVVAVHAPTTQPDRMTEVFSEVVNYLRKDNLIGILQVAKGYNGSFSNSLVFARHEEDISDEHRRWKFHEDVFSDNLNMALRYVLEDFYLKVPHANIPVRVPYFGNCDISISTSYTFDCEHIVAWSDQTPFWMANLRCEIESLTQ